MLSKTCISILSNAGLLTLLPQDEKGRVLCDHKLMRENMEKRAQLLKKNGYVDPPWESVLKHIIETNKTDFRLHRIKQLSHLGPQKIKWFWDTIDKIDWKRDMDYTKAEKRFKALNLSKDEFIDLIHVIRMHYAVLDCYMSEKFSSCVPTPGADDSYSDFLWSAVGCGKEFYTKLFSELYTWPREEIQNATVETFTNVFGDDFYNVD